MNLDKRDKLTEPGHFEINREQGPTDMKSMTRPSGSRELLLKSPPGWRAIVDDEANLYRLFASDGREVFQGHGDDLVAALARRMSGQPANRIPEMPSLSPGQGPGQTPPFLSMPLQPPRPPIDDNMISGDRVVAILNGIAAHLSVMHGGQEERSWLSGFLRGAILAISPKEASGE